MRATFAVFHERDQKHKPDRCPFCKGEEDLQMYFEERRDRERSVEIFNQQREKEEREAERRMIATEKRHNDRSMQFQDAIARNDLTGAVAWVVYICRLFMAQNSGIENIPSIFAALAASKQEKDVIPPTLKEVNILYHNLLDFCEDRNFGTISVDYGISQTVTAQVYIDSVRKIISDRDGNGKLIMNVFGHKCISRWQPGNNGIGFHGKPIDGSGREEK